MSDYLKNYFNHGYDSEEAKDLFSTEYAEVYRKQLKDGEIPALLLRSFIENHDNALVGDGYKDFDVPEMEYMSKSLFEDYQQEALAANAFILTVLDAFKNGTEGELKKRLKSAGMIAASNSAGNKDKNIMGFVILKKLGLIDYETTTNCICEKVSVSDRTAQNRMKSIEQSKEFEWAIEYFHPRGAMISRIQRQDPEYSETQCKRIAESRIKTVRKHFGYVLSEQKAFDTSSAEQFNALFASFYEKEFESQNEVINVYGLSHVDLYHDTSI